MLIVVENVRQKHLDWVQGILDARKWNRTQLAREAGIDPSTLTKFWNDKTGTARLNTYTIEKIEEAAGVPAFEMAPPFRSGALHEPEAQPFDHGPGPAEGLAAVAAWKANRNGLDAWIMKGRALELAGYLPGDIMMVDMNGLPHNGDAVCAQILDRNGKAETVFRIYEHPFLVSATLDNTARKPILLDDDWARVRGVVVGCIRSRRAA